MNVDAKRKKMLLKIEVFYNNKRVNSHGVYINYKIYLSNNRTSKYMKKKWHSEERNGQFNNNDWRRQCSNVSIS